MDYFSTPTESTFTVGMNIVLFLLTMELSTPVFNIMHIMPGTTGNFKQFEHLYYITFVQILQIC